MKRKLLLIITLLFAMIGTLAIVSACGPREDVTETPQAGEEVGEYYCDVNTAEYSLTLTDQCEYTLVMGGNRVTGNYTPTGEDLVLKSESGDILASYFDGVVTLTYRSETYKFLRKVDYHITFETNGGSAVAEVAVRNGRKAAKPAAPTLAGKTFVGWYLDSAFKSHFTFEEAVTSDLKLYARFETPIDPEYTVTFDANGGRVSVDSATTVGHMLFDLPTPTWEGHTFVGWWVSHYESAEKLTYRYSEQVLGGNTTLFAVWAGETPALSVGEKSITWTSVGTNSQYNIIVKNEKTDEELLNTRSGQTSADFDFSKQDAGDYSVSVTVNNQTATCYYRNKGLDRVTVFEVKGNKLFFNAVDHAENYYITVVCGKEDHHSGRELVTDRAYDFSECEMKDEQIAFTVTAEANGYLASESAPYYVTRTLPVVKGISVDSSAELLKWNRVENATSYDVVIKQEGSVVYSANIVDGTSAPLKDLNRGVLNISVTPKARGWNSPSAATYSYRKQTLATPRGLHADIANSKLVWNEVKYATGYEVTIGTNAPVKVTDPEIEFKSEYLTAGSLDYAVKVRALGENTVKASLWTDELNVRSGKLGGELRYRDGVLSWDPVFGVSDYYLSVNDEEEVHYENLSSIPVTFTEAKEYAYKLRAEYSDGTSDELRLSVIARELKFVVEAGESSQTFYLATGDKVTFPEGEEATVFGYDLKGWYTALEGGELYEDSVFFAENNVTLYAHWKPKAFHITLRAGAYGNQSAEIDNGVTAYYDQPVTLPMPDCTDPVKGFVGWYDFNGVVAFTGYDCVIPHYLQGADITLYAKWVDVLSFVPVYTTTAANRTVDHYQVKKHPDIVQSGIKVIEIPKEYKGKPVTEVIDFTNVTTLETISIPDCVTLIAIETSESAFTGCTNLKEIKIYETSYNGPKYYSDYNGILIYDNPETHLRELKFYPAARTDETFDIPDGIQVIPSQILYGNTTLKSVSIPASVTLIESQAFGNSSMYDSKLETITFRSAAQGVAEQKLVIQEEAFYHLTQLKHLTLPSRVQNFNMFTMFKMYNNEYAFETIEFEGNGDYSVQDGMILKNLAGNDKELVFYPFTAEEFTIPEAVTSIGESAVESHTLLTEVTIPKQVTHIGKRAFYDLRNLSSLTFAGTATDLALTIEEDAFNGLSYNNTSNPLTELHLPANCVKVARNAFYNTKIKTVYLESGETSALEMEDGAFAAELDWSGNPKSLVTSVHVVGKGIHGINFAAVFGQGITELKIDEENPHYQMDAEGNVAYEVKENANKEKELTQIVWVKNGVTQITIPDTVKSIASNNFKNRSSLTSITIPASVTYIGPEAFLGCSGLTEVIFANPAPDTVREELSIGDRAFSGCTNLTAIDLPEGLTMLGSQVFMGCNKLASVTLPTTIENITPYEETESYSTTMHTYFGLFSTFGSYPDEVPLKELKMHDGTPQHYSVKDNAIYRLAENKHDNKFEESELLYFAISAETEHLVIPNTVEKIWEHAFFFDATGGVYHLTKISFEGDALAPKYDETGAQVARTLEVMDGTFQKASSVTEIDLPHGTTILGKNAFRESGITAFEVPNTVTSIGAETFAGCKALRELTFEDGGDAELRFEDGSTNGIFGSSYNSGTVTEIELPARTVYLGANVFTGSKIVSVEIPASVTAIGESAFKDTPLSFLTFAQNSDLQTIGPQAFSGVNLDSVVIPASVTTIGVGAFAKNSRLKSVKFEDNNNLNLLSDNPSGLSVSWVGGSFAQCPVLSEVDFGANTKLTTIGVSTFENDPLLKSFVVPLSVEEIAADAFKGSGLETVTFENKEGELSKLHYLNTAFAGTKITSFAFPETEQEIIITDRAFSGCTELESIHLSSTVYSIKSAFAGCTIKEVTVADNNPSYKVDTKNHMLLNKYGVDIILVFGTLTGELEIPSGSIMIGAGAFEGMEITSVFIPNTVVRIDDGAFKNCNKLTTVEFEAGSALTSLGKEVFLNCTLLENINFNRTTQLEELATDDAYTPASNTFTDCVHLTSLDLSKTRLTAIPADTFKGCTSLDTLILPNTVENFNAKLTDTKVTELDLSHTAVTEIASRLFAGNEVIESLSLPAALTAIGSYAFQNCHELATLTLNAAPIETLGDYAFQGCSSLTSIDLMAARITEVPNYVFSGCSSLAEVKLPNGLTKIGQESFKDCEALKDFDLTKMTSIGIAAFNGAGLKKVTLSGNVTEWKDGSSYSSSASTGIFANNEVLSEVVFDTTLPENPHFAGYMFSKCTNLTTLTFNPGTQVGTFGSNMFTDCTAIDTVTLPASFKTLDYSTASNTFKGCTGIKHVDLSASASTELGYSMFSGCTAIEDFKFPTALEEIPYQAFKGCTNLTQVQLPATVNEIGYDAFNGCTGLGSIDLPDAVEEIGSGCFTGCALTKVVLPKSLTSLSYSAFKDCANLQEVDFSNVTELTTLSSTTFQNCAKLTSITIPASVTRIDSECFRGSGLTSVTIPVSVTILGNGAFEDCASLAKVNFNCGDVVNSNYSSATAPTDLFKNCEKLTTITFTPGEDREELKAIGETWFEGCVGLEKITLPESVVELQDGAFTGCTKLHEINVNNITKLGNDVFKDCTALFADEKNWSGGAFYLGNLLLSYDEAKLADDGKLTVKEGTTSIVSKVFANSEKLKEVSLPASLVSLGVNAFEGSKALNKVEFAADGKLTAIPDNAFKDCAALANVTIPAYVTTIGESSFRNTGIANLTIPATVTEIGTYAFAENTKLTAVTVTGSAAPAAPAAEEEAKALTVLPAHVFEKCELLSSVTLPATVTGIGANAFDGCKTLSSFDFQHITDIGAYAFQGCGFTEINFPAGIIGTTSYGSAASDIGDGAFQNNESLKKVDFTNATKLVVISKQLFNGCKQLATVTIPDTAVIESIEADAFNGTQISEITIPKTVNAIGNNAFKDCTKLTSVTLPESLVTRTSDYSTATDGWGNATFAGCTNLSTVDLSKATKITKIPKEAFSGCTSLQDITIPVGVTHINDNAFKNTGLKSFKSSTGIAYTYAAHGFGVGVFEGCASLTEIDLSASANLTELADEVFKGLTSLETLKLPNALQTIGDSVFEGCTKLKDFTFSTSLLTIGMNAFKDCTALTKLEFPNGTASIGNSAFEGCTHLATLSLPNSLADMSEAAFKGCTSLTKVTMPMLVANYAPASSSYYSSTGLGINLFEGCTQLKEVDFSGCTVVTHLSDALFKGCTMLDTVKFPSGLTYIGKGCFEGCTALTKLDLPDDVSSVDDYAFKGCTGLSTFKMPASLKDYEKSTSTSYWDYKTDEGFGKGVFEGCTNLTSVDFSVCKDLKKFSDETFSGCTHLSTVTLSDAIESIGANAFNGCTALKSLVIPASVTSIANDAFTGTTGLTLHFVASEDDVKTAFGEDEWTAFKAALPEGTTVDFSYTQTA